MFRDRLFPALALISGAVLGCSSESPAAPSERPVYYRTVATGNPVNSLSAIVDVDAARFDSARVRYWVPGSAVHETPAAEIGPDSTVRMAVLGLAASSAYQLETVLYSGAKAFPVDTIEFLSGPRPAWIPQIGALGTDTTPGLLAISLPDGGVIVDNSGTVVWYAEMAAGTLNSFQPHANGTYTILRADDLTRFHVLNLLGEEIGTLTCNGRRTRFHDVMIRRGGDAWLLCDEERTMDLSGMGGMANATVTGTVIQHLSATGDLLFEWSALDHFEITDLPEQDRDGSNVNFTHGNGIELDSDGDIIASFRSLSEITKIDGQTGEVLWRFGGLANEFTILNDAKGSFQRQHGIRVAGPSQIQFLDNGLTQPSRLVRYLIDAQDRTALLVMDFVDAPTTFSLVGGSTAYYPNGHGLVSFGQDGRVVEVDAAGNRAWELTGVDGRYVFRAERIRSLYDPTPLVRGTP
jgi:hypothetical protein